MSNALEKLGDAIEAAINEDIAATMSIVGSVHISLAMALVRSNGKPGDENKQITIEDSTTGRKFIITALEASGK
ncbi:hypothetical protein GJQ54_05105 [Oceanospirillaceae bacterium ASx5O]|nr:hypothetical protein GJQ54_05105 [Oceanospirillaceae bacterium ASx5O]